MVALSGGCNGSLFTDDNRLVNEDNPGTRTGAGCSADGGMEKVAKAGGHRTLRSGISEW